MRNLLLLLLLPVFCCGQNVGTGEYDCYFINSAGKLYDLQLALPSAMNVPASLTWKGVAGGLHNGAAIDNSGHVWTLGDNSVGVAGNGSLLGTSAPSQVLTDSSGKTFDSVVQVALWCTTGTGVVAVKSTGTLWIWGNLAGNMRGNGTYAATWTKPVRVIIPGNRKVTKVCVNAVIEALCSDGTVWSWGGTSSAVLGTNNADCSRPQQVVLPQTAKDIAGGGVWSYAVGSNGTLYGWGAYTNAMFGTYSGSIITTPLDLTKYMNFPLPVSKAFVNTIASYFILSDSSLWSCGDNIVGSLGNGKQLDQATSAYPWATWPDPSATGQLLQPVPTKILSGTKFVNVFVATADVFYFYAQDSKGQLYSAGRNKGGVLGNGVRECDYIQGLIGSQLPNSWNVPLLTAVNPLSLKTAIAQTSPFCMLTTNATSSPCNLCATQPNGQPVPGTIQAESYTAMSGVASQNTSDIGGGLNVGWIDAGDWMDFDVNVAAMGTYTANFRVSSIYNGASLQLRAENGTVLATVKIPNTGNFQAWQTVFTTLTLPAGFQTLRLYSTSSAGTAWNINWMQFVSGTSALPVPGTIQAEAYSAMSGVASQATSDVGGGLNLGWIDAGDWMDYQVNVAAAGTYTANFRVATPYNGASLQVKTQSAAVLATVKIPNTGNFQTWKTVSATLALPAGFQTLRVYSTSSAGAGWNFNWMQFVSGVSATQTTTTNTLSYDSFGGDSTTATTPASFTLYPNPVKDAFILRLNNGYTGNLLVQIVDASGVTKRNYKFNKDQSSMVVNLSAADLPVGTYFVRAQIGTWSETKKMTKF